MKVKKLYWMMGGILICAGLVIGIVFWKFQKEIKKDDPEYIVQFIKEHRADKIIIPIAYAQEAAEGRINPQQQVDLKELEVFYIPKTDGGAHEAWLAQLNLQGVDHVPLSEVASGMIAYSSNANTEYLMHVLGFQAINDVLTQLHVEDHEPLYPIVSALHIPVQVLKEKNLTKKETLAALQEMDMAEYRERASSIHASWIEQPLTYEEKAEAQKLLNMDFQKIWSDRLIRATTNDYISILEKLNNKNFFSAEVHKYLDPVMEQLMQNPKNQEWLTNMQVKRVDRLPLS